MEKKLSKKPHKKIARRGGYIPSHQKKKCNTVEIFFKIAAIVIPNIWK